LLVFLFNLYVFYQILYNIVDTTVFINENEYEIYITNFQSNYNNKLNTNYFDRFIELFKSNSSIKYFPNSFVDVSFFDKYISYLNTFNVMAKERYLPYT